LPLATFAELVAAAAAAADAEPPHDWPPAALDRVDGRARTIDNAFTKPYNTLRVAATRKIAAARRLRDAAAAADGDAEAAADAARDAAGQEATDAIFSCARLKRSFQLS
jgi:hypothetical protein